MRAPHKYKQRMAAVTAVAAAVGLLTGAVLGTDVHGDGTTGRPDGNGSVIEAPASGTVSSGLVVTLDDGPDPRWTAKALGKPLP
ncbi:hypothetical protein [Streptomyces sp. PvR034]|uniref:hypothetical protein n=1 Tax=Streptomyces sp. PvR034 TaxID=3156401 RepID=UPI003397187D